MTKKFSLKSRDGAIRLFWLFVALIVLFSFAAQLVSTDFGRIKIQRITIDARGGELVGDLYYPRGASEDNPLPAIVVTHGGGCNWGVTRYTAQEIARRGFVTFNVSAYSNGLSYMPMYEERHQRFDEMDRYTALGLHDALNFIRNLEFVDETRLGMAGHSMGAIRTTRSMILDCGYLNLNDRLINILYETFGQTFTAEEISQDATALAEARLNADQLVYFNYLKDEATTEFNSRLKAAIPFGQGNDQFAVWGPTDVEVAGHTVSRDIQCNFVLIDGEFEVNATKMSAGWYEEHPIEPNYWYSIDDDTRTNTQLGTYDAITVLDSPELAEAIENRTARLYYISPNESHSKDFHSTYVTSMAVRGFEQMLGYNNGELGSSEAISYTSNSWPLTSAFNCLAMFSMIGMAISFACILVDTKTFACCASQPAAPAPFNKKRYWAIAGITVILGFVAMWFGIKKASLIVKTTALTPASVQSVPLGLILTLTVGTLLIMAYNVSKSKKELGTTGLERLGLNIGIGGILKAFLAAFLVFAVAYSSLQFIVFFFNQDYRMWMTVYTELKANYFGWVIWYALLLFPMYVVLSCGINYTVRTDIPEWKDTLICVLVNSLGIWILCALNYVLALISFNGKMFCDFILAYGNLLHVPFTVLIMRLTYKKTNNVWIGAGICAFFIAWTLCSGAGLGGTNDPNNLLAAFLNY